MEVVKTITSALQTLREAGRFSKLIAAVMVAELGGTLSGAGPLTLLAPNDDAFAKLPAGALDSLLTDKAKLRNLLTSHIIAGKVTSIGMKGMRSVKSLQGREVRIDGRKGVRVDNANVVNADIECSNGVIHEVDAVLTV